MKGRWCYLYGAIDSTGVTIDFLLSALRDGAAAKRLFRKASAVHHIHSPESSTPIRHAFAGRRFQEYRRKEFCAAAVDIDRSNT